MRTIIEIPEDQLSELSRFCRKHAISRAEAIRQAIARHLERERDAPSHEAFGLWGDRAFSSTEMERGVRAGWAGRSK
jgi:hypothetical protein